MNTCKLYLISLCLSLVCMPIEAVQRVQVNLSNYTIKRHGNQVSMAFTLKAKDIRLHSDQYIRVELSLESRQQRLVLPYVIYTGNKRYKYDHRDELLSGKPQFTQGSVYKTIRGIDKNTIYNVDYELTIPYQAWMEEALLKETQFFHDCCNEWQADSQVLLAELGLEGGSAGGEHPLQADVWMPDPGLYQQMISMLTAPAEVLKERSSAIEVKIDYPVNVYKVLPSFGMNAQQLKKVETFMKSVMSNELISLNGILITGYASPEGTYQSNNKLAKNRAEGFKEYIMTKYKLYQYEIQTESIAEDWDGLVRFLNENPSDYRNETLLIIENYDIFDGREKKLMELRGGLPYKDMLKRFFPLLRRIELQASYQVSAISDDKAAQLIYSNPRLLSLNEMYRITRRYTPGTADYRRIYEVAAQTYPNDLIANNNAAAACLMNGDANAALVYLKRMNNQALSFVNWGVYYYLQGDIEQALTYFERALQLSQTHEQAKKNLSLLNM